MWKELIRSTIILNLAIQIPFMACAAEKQQDRRIVVVRNIVDKNVLDTGVDLKIIHQEVSRHIPLDPGQNEEYLALIRKRDMAVKKKFPMTDQQLRRIAQDHAKNLYPLYRVGDNVSITYLLHGKPFRASGKFYRKSGPVLYIGSAKVAISNIPAEIYSRFDVEQTQKNRKKYVADKIASYHRDRNRFAESLMKDEIQQSQGYLRFDHQWVSCRDFIQIELKRIAADKGISLEELMKGTPAEPEENLPSPEIILDSTGRTLVKYPPEAPNKRFKIPDSVRIIGAKAFEGCKNLTRIQMPPGIVEISDHAFSGCENLSSINLPSSIVRIGKNAFSDCKKLKNIIIPKQVRILSKNCFMSSGLETISLQGNIRSIEKWALADTKIKKIVIPSSVQSIEDGAFWKTSARIESENPRFRIDQQGVLFDQEERKILWAPLNLGEYAIPRTITKISDFAFSFSNLTKVKIPRNVISIGDSAFVNCKNLESVVFSSGIQRIGNNAFAGSGLKKVILPDSIDEIGSAAFSGCANLEEISFPQNLTILKWAVCADCGNLRKVSVSPGLRQIKGRAFWECRKLAEINIPMTIVSIEKGAFSGAPVASKIEGLMAESFKIPGIPLVPFNWKFTLVDYRAQGFNVRYLGTASNVEEYNITNGFESFICLKHTDKAVPFCFVFSGRIPRLATSEIANALKDPDKKYHYMRTRSFDADAFDQGRSEYMGIVFLTPKYKLLLQFDRKDYPQMAIYRLDDNRDETYYRMLHYKPD